MSKWAVFLDRDGVINREVEFLKKPEEFELLPRSAEAIRILNENNIPVFVVSNQPVIGRGMCTEQDVKDVHEKMHRLLAEKGAKVDDIFICPHHSSKGLGKYKVECECRKPKPGMILDAAKKHDIDLVNSFMVGDKIGDIKAGYLAGCKTLLVRTGYGGQEGWNDAEPDYTFDDLYEAVEFIIKGGREIDN